MFRVVQSQFRKLYGDKLLSFELETKVIRNYIYIFSLSNCMIKSFINICYH